MSDCKFEKSHCAWNWLPILLAGLALVVLLPVFGFTLDGWSIAVTLGVAGALMALACAHRVFPGRTVWPIFFGSVALAQMILLTAIITPLTYVGAALKFPMQDRLFGAIDLAMGYHAEAFVAFVNDHALLAGLLNFGYGMIAWPVFAIPIVLAATSRFLRLQQFMFAFIISLTIACIVSAFLPAMGIYQHWGIALAKYPNINSLTYVSYMNDIVPTIDGSLRHLSLLGLNGLVTFPSFHATCAILYFWAFHPVRFFGPVALVCNVLMLFGTLTVGGHFLFDVIVGVVSALASIALAKALTSRFDSAQAQRFNPPIGQTTADSLS